MGLWSLGVLAIVFVFFGGTEIQGPNDSHWCVVGEPLEPSLSIMLDHLENQPDVSGKVTGQDRDQD